MADVVKCSVFLADRNVLVDITAFDPQQTGGIPLGNIMAHELGHTLGFRHGHVRPEANAAESAEDTLEITERAAKEFRHVVSQKDLPDTTAMRLSVKGGGCSGFEYQIDIEVNEPDEFDIVSEPGRGTTVTVTKWLRS